MLNNSGFFSFTSFNKTLYVYHTINVYFLQSPVDNTMIFLLLFSTSDRPTTRDAWRPEYGMLDSYVFSVLSFVNRINPCQSGTWRKKQVSWLIVPNKSGNLSIFIPIGHLYQLQTLTNCGKIKGICSTCVVPSSFCLSSNYYPLHTA